jgi:malate dehydrogenase
LSSVGGVPLTELLSAEKNQRDRCAHKNCGAEIGGLLKTGSAYYAPSAGAVEMAEAILKDQKRMLPCAVELTGEYGINGLFVGVVCKLGGKGMEGIAQFKLNADEQAEFEKSVAAVKSLVMDLMRFKLN